MRVENLSYAYGSNVILDNINFRVIGGEMLGIVGDSGAGKSTLLRLLGSLLPLQKGEVSETEDVGIIFQNFNLFPHLNVIDNLSLSLRLNKKESKEDIKKSAVTLLSDFGILDKAKSYPDELSGGEKQRVAIARALMLNPKILLIDEATSNLDPKRVKSFMQILKNLQDQKMTIIIVNHDHQLMQLYCDRLLYLENGKISKIDVLKSKLSKNIK